MWTLCRTGMLFMEKNPTRRNGLRHGALEIVRTPNPVYTSMLSDEDGVTCFWKNCFKTTVSDTYKQNIDVSTQK